MDISVTNAVSATSLLVFQLHEDRPEVSTL